MNSDDGRNTAVQTAATKTSKKAMTQQVFHPSLFTRQRSNSLSDVIPRGSNTSTVPTMLNLSTVPNNLPTTITDSELPDIDKLPPTWQRVPKPKKRKTSEQSPPPTTRQTGNRFAGLPIDITEQEANQQPAPSKPPPIILYGVDDLEQLTRLIETVITPADFKYRIINKNNLRVMINTAENYKKVIGLIRENGLIGHTFTPKDAKCCRFVIKDLHHTTPHEAIREAVEATNNEIVGEIINARYGPNKRPTSTFFVNVKQNIHNREIKNIQYIFNQKVKIEDPRKAKSIAQCQRCQQYGHTKNNCMRPHRCVKCGEGHKSSDCTKKDRSTPAKCALCSCDHPANYKGCEVYREILARKNNHTQRGRVQQTRTVLNPPAEQSTTNTRDSIKTHQKSYAEAVHGSNSTPQELPQAGQQQTNTLEHFLMKQSEKMDLLIQQIGSLVSLITTLVSKLTK